MRDHEVYSQVVEPDDIAPHVRDLEEAVRAQDDRYDPAVTVRDGQVELRTGTSLTRRDREAVEAFLDGRLDTGEYRSAMLAMRTSWPDPGYELVVD